MDNRLVMLLLLLEIGWAGFVIYTINEKLLEYWQSRYNRPLSELENLKEAKKK